MAAANGDTSVFAAKALRACSAAKVVMVDMLAALVWSSAVTQFLAPVLNRREG